MQRIVEWMTEILVTEHSNTTGIPAEQPGMKMPEPIRRDTPHHMEALDGTYWDSMRLPETDHDMPSLLRPRLTPGTVVTWESPVLGLVNGGVSRVHEHGDVDVYHPVAEAIVRIPRTWIRR
jgi:hypothetical protein